MISIIIPVFNAEKSLERTLQSVLNQTHQDWECVLIDDGSMDSSPEICDRYVAGDSRFRVIHQANTGVSSARNVGLESVIGDWITFCDSDDELTPNALSDFAEAVHRFPQVEVIRGGHTTITTSGKRADHFVMDWMEIEYHSVALKLSEENFYSGFMWSSCFRKDIVSDERFEEDITWCEDHIFTYRCMLKSKSVVFTPTTVYVYHLDDRFPAGFGERLSFKSIDYEMAIRSAKEQRSVKLLMADGDNVMEQLVESQYFDTVRMALYYAFFGHNFFQVLKLSKEFPFIHPRNVIRLWLGFIKTRIVHCIKCCFNLY